MPIYGKKGPDGWEWGWWDLFCSEACCRSRHPDLAGVERFAGLAELAARVGWDAGDMAVYLLRCEACGEVLEGNGGT
jgi:hypothetical protein